MCPVKKILALGFVWLLVACSGYSPFDLSEMSGTYHLISVEGQALPATVTDVGDDVTPQPVTISFGVIQLSLDGEFRFKITVDGITTTEFGMFSMVPTEDARLNFSLDGRTFGGILSGKRLTVYDGSLIFVYERSG
tara:strand:+ start:130 stop:537 length:408 start_codon:yes stop_codon:yes gene_type:complete